MLVIRPAQPDDMPRLAAIYRDAAMVIGAERYDAEQVRMWASYADDAARFSADLSRGWTLVSDVDGCPASFGQLHPLDHLAMIYCDPHHARRGLAGGVCDRLETLALVHGATVIHTEASRISRHFFAKRGYTVTKVELIDRNGVRFERFRMSKALDPQMITIDAFRKAFYATLSPEDPARNQPCPADCFGDSPGLADELLIPVLNWTKTATCSCTWEWEAEGEPWPEVGFLSIILDGAGRPRAIIETVDVTIQRFGDVDADFAYAEGEDDRTLESWRREHWRYFTRALARIGRTPSLDMPLVCERFRVIFPIQILPPDDGT